MSDQMIRSNFIHGSTENIPQINYITAKKRESIHSLSFRKDAIIAHETKKNPKTKENTYNIVKLCHPTNGEDYPTRNI